MQYRELQFAGREFTVFLHVDLIEALQKEISRASLAPDDPEPNGLLLGRGNQGGAIVISHAPQSGPISGNKDPFWKQYSSSLKGQADPLEILGYYRLSSGTDPVPNDTDMHVMRDFLPESASILLLIGTVQGRKTGSVFIWAGTERQRLLAGNTELQFPDNPPRIDSAAQEHSPDRAKNWTPPELSGQTASLSATPGDENMPPPPSSKTGERPITRVLQAAAQIARRSPLVWALALCIAAIPVWRLVLTKSYMPVPAQSSHVKPLSLKARIVDGRLRVTWDASSPILGSALSAALYVEPKDGTRDAQHLGHDQLMAGSAVFQPPTGHAQIRLVVFSEATTELVAQFNPAVSTQPVASAAELATIKDTPPVRKIPLVRRVESTADRDRTILPKLAKSSSTTNRPRQLAIGFTEETWRDRGGPAKKEALSGLSHLSECRIPPRPIRLVQPDSFYRLYPFTVDSVQLNVRVNINRFGAVTSAESLTSGNALIRDLSARAVSAARASTFAPARYGDEGVPSTAVLSYQFLRMK